MAAHLQYFAYLQAEHMEKGFPVPSLLGLVLHPTQH